MEKSSSSKSIIFSELKYFISFAFPIVVSNSTVTLMMFIDRLFLSHYSINQGEAYINASLIGFLTSYTITGLFVSTAGYSNALVSQYIGAGKPKYSSKIVMQTFYLALFSYPLLLSSTLFLEDFFLLFNHNELQTELEISYTKIMLLGSFLIILKSGWSSFFIGVGNSKIVMISDLCGLLLNIPLNYALIFGFGIIPELGIIGAGLATIISVFFSLIILIAEYYRLDNQKKYATAVNFKFNWLLFKKMVRYGVPSGIELLFGVGVFNYFILVMNSYGSLVGSAVTITINWDSMFFIPMLGLGHATTALVGRYMGAKDIPSAKRITRLSILTTIAYAAVIGILLLLFSSPLINMFLVKMDNAQGVYDLALIMVRLIIVYLLADAIHIILSSSLRGSGDTLAVMIIFMSLSLLFGIVITVFINTKTVAPLEAWFIFIGFVFCLGIGMLIRYLQGHWQKIDMVD